MSTFAYKIFMKRSTRKYGKRDCLPVPCIHYKRDRRGHDRMVDGFTTLWDSLSVTCDMSVVSPGTPVSSTNKTDHNDITEILLKLALNTIHQPTNQPTNQPLKKHYSQYMKYKLDFGSSNASLLVLSWISI
jgi:hypothetical protein